MHGHHYSFDLFESVAADILIIYIKGFESHSLGPFNVIVKRIIIIVVNIYIYRFAELRRRWRLCATKARQVSSLDKF